uniref:Histone-binding protein RBBP7 n=1 Tax=Neospora caninum (strain Liverpool) TaxID=572307 RepID=A0A0F7UEF3_NEOCL|nr:TPA: Histone-binding protein RBBP7 [Neospora caninum Liverpool]
MALSDGVGPVNSARVFARPRQSPTLRKRLRKDTDSAARKARDQRRASREGAKQAERMGDKSSSTRRSVEGDGAVEMPPEGAREHKRTRARLDARPADSASHAPSQAHQKKRDGNVSEGDGSPGPGRPPPSHAGEAIPSFSKRGTGSREAGSKRREREGGATTNEAGRGEEKEKRGQGPESDGHEETAPPFSPASFRAEAERAPLHVDVFETAHDGRAGPKHVPPSRLRTRKISRHRLDPSPNASPRSGSLSVEFSAPTSPLASPSALRDALSASCNLRSALHAASKSTAHPLYPDPGSSRYGSRNHRPRSVSPDARCRRGSTDSSELSSCSGGVGDRLSPSAASHRSPLTYLPVSPCLAPSTGKKRARGERRGKGGKRGKAGVHRGDGIAGIAGNQSGETATAPCLANAGEEGGATRTALPSATGASAPAAAATAGGAGVSAASLQGLYRANNRHWQNNCLLLYEHVMAHTLEWPSLTTQWMKSRNPKASGAMGQTVLVATHTSGPQHLNYLLLIEVTLPLEPIHPCGMHFGQRQGKHYVGFDFGEEDSRKFTVTCRIPHEGESNKARFCPSDQTKIASKALDGCVYVFDFCKFGPYALPFSTPHGDGSRNQKGGKVREVDETAPPTDFMALQAEVVLSGHTDEGWGLEWGPPGRENFVASAADDGIICVWDVQAKPAERKRLPPLHKLVADCNLRPLQDVCWKRGEGDGDVLLGIGDDGYLNMWDLRVSPAPVVRTQCSWTSANALAANANAPYVVATAGADKGVSIWDLRALRRPAHRLLHAHGEAVTCLKWAPGEKTTLASGSTDRLIRIFDLSLVGAEQESDDAEDGPPELLFVHGGHLGAVNDFDWNPQPDLFSSLMLASVSEDNALQIWQPTRKAFKRESLFVEGRDGDDCMQSCEADGDDVE